MKRFQINIPVRFRNKTFWLAFIPAIIILIQSIGEVIGIHLDLTATQEKLINVINAVFIVLAILGVVNDPTTSGLSDSDQAMSYAIPRNDTVEYSTFDTDKIPVNCVDANTVSPMDDVLKEAVSVESDLAQSVENLKSGIKDMKKGVD